MASFLAMGKEERRLLIFIRWRGQDGVMAGGMEAQNDFSPWGSAGSWAGDNLESGCQFLVELLRLQTRGPDTVPQGLLPRIMSHKALPPENKCRRVGQLLLRHFVPVTYIPAFLWRIPISSVSWHLPPLGQSQNPRDRQFHGLV